jgi:ABC-type transport system involved in multi-copper enzyme maturation permease subunit
VTTEVTGTPEVPGAVAPSAPPAGDGAPRLSMNPVVGRELTERLRGLRSFVALSIFVLLLTLTAFLVFEGSGAASDGDLSTRTSVGRLVFEAVLLIMTLLVLFFVPGIAAGAIAGERERQTLATLQVTLLRPRAILGGKIAAALAYLVLLVIAALPVLAVAWMLGGIRVVDIGRGVLGVIVVALFVATMVVSVSAFATRVQTATILAYGFTALLVIIGPLLYGVGAVLDARSEAPGDEVAAPAFLLTMNPLALVADVGGTRIEGFDGPLSGMRDLLLEAKQENDGSWFALFPATPGELGPFNGAVADDRDDSGLPIWLLAGVSMTIVAVVLFVGAARRLRTPAEVER